MSHEDDEEMRDQYDFSGGERGKHFRAYREGHIVRIAQYDGMVEIRYYKPLPGTVTLDPDL